MSVITNFPNNMTKHQKSLTSPVKLFYFANNFQLLLNDLNPALWSLNGTKLNSS